MGPRAPAGIAAYAHLLVVGVEGDEVVAFHLFFGLMPTVMV